MKKVALVFLVIVMLGVASAAAACGPSHRGYFRSTHWSDCYYYAPMPMCHAACTPRDLRVRKAKAEKLKADFHYYALSGHPCERATAKMIAIELDCILDEIDIWLEHK